MIEEEKNLNTEVVISLKNINKTFYIQEDKKFDLRALVASFFKQGKTKKFEALKNINLKIHKGEFVGIIGRNGSGKSTLLKIISGIYAADKGGEIEIKGKLVPFLELGVGFNAELSGRENIFLNGTILGLSKKFLQKKFNEIVDFAELRDFIEMPVKNYSSGMLVRLAFSIAIQADADIYILDEILAVGDAKFQAKSLRVIQDLVRQNKTIIFVTHDSNAIENFCNRVVYLNNHQIEFIGNPTDGVNLYKKSLFDDMANEKRTNEASETKGEDKLDVQNKGITIVKSYILDSENKEKYDFLDKDDTIQICFEYKLIDKSIKNAVFGFALQKENGNLAFGTNTKARGIQFNPKDSGILKFKLKAENFVNGNFQVIVGIFDYESEESIFYQANILNFDVLWNTKEKGMLSLPVEWEID
jgi:ABC-type polysaccharide/polyol phosphate transport system ATPase subunit